VTAKVKYGSSGNYYKQSSIDSATTHNCGSTRGMFEVLSESPAKQPFSLNHQLAKVFVIYYFTHDTLH
jgi:hypothetical protein